MTADNEIANLKDRLKSALLNEAKWQDLNNVLEMKLALIKSIRPSQQEIDDDEEENKKLKYSLQQCESARKAEIGAWKPEAERLRKRCDELEKNNQRLKDSLEQISKG